MTQANIVLKRLNLHHNITNDLKLNDNKEKYGRSTFEYLFTDLEQTYEREVYNSYTKGLIDDALEGDEELLKDLAIETYIDPHFITFANSKFP